MTLGSATFLQLCMTEWFLITSHSCKRTQANMLGGNNKTVAWSAACPIFDLFGKGTSIFASTYAPTNIGFPLPNKANIRQQPTK